MNSEHTRLQDSNQWYMARQNAKATTEWWNVNLLYIRVIVENLYKHNCFIEIYKHKTWT